MITLSPVLKKKKKKAREYLSQQIYILSKDKVFRRGYDNTTHRMKIYERGLGKCLILLMLLFGPLKINTYINKEGGGGCFITVGCGKTSRLLH